MTTSDLVVSVVLLVVAGACVLAMALAGRAPAPTPHEPWRLRGTPERHRVQGTWRTALRQRWHEARTARADAGLTPDEIPARLCALRWE